MSKRDVRLFIQDIKDFRNLLIHEYFGVDFEIVYNTIENDLPLLYQVIQKMEQC